MSTTFSPLTLAACLRATATFTQQSNLGWRPKDELQYRLMQFLTPFRALLERIDEWQNDSEAAISPAMERLVQAFAASTVDGLNKQLMEAGYPEFVLHGLWPPSVWNFGVVGVSDIAAAWREPGTPAVMEVDGRFYDAFNMGVDQGCEVVHFTGFDQPGVVIYAGEFEIRMTEIPDPTWQPPPEAQLELLEQSFRLAQAPTRTNSGKIQAQLPMVLLEQSPDLSWLRFLKSQRIPPGNQWSLVHAGQCVRLGMSHLGLRALQATVAEVSLPDGDEGDVFVMNQPFMVTVAVMLDDQPLPIFGAYVTRDAWRNPGDLAGM